MSEVEKSQTFKSVLEKLNLSLDEDNPLQGLGYNNLLFMATELLLLRQEDDFSLLLIEEPEAHLHPQLQMKLLKFIKEEFSDDASPKLQSILTTHSPNLASKAQLESLIIMANGKAFSLRKDETQLDNDDYVFLEKFLDVTKSNLFFAKSILMVGRRWRKHSSSNNCRAHRSTFGELWCFSCKYRQLSFREVLKKYSSDWDWMAMNIEIVGFQQK